MKVPYAQAVYGEEEIAAVVSVLRNNTAMGPKVSEFEDKIAQMFGKKHGVMVNSGSSANLLAFELLNLEPGDEVVTPLLTFGTVVAPIVQKQLVPIFVDVEQGTYVVNPDEVERAISPRTKALMIPSLLGNIPNLEKLAQIAEKHGLWLIEDSADTLGASYNGLPTGHYSHISTTSFYGSHIITAAGGGGMVMVHDPKLAERLVVLRGWGRQSSLYDKSATSELIENRFTVELDGVAYDNKFVFSEIGYNFLPLELQAAFGLVQLSRFPQFAEARKRRFNELYEFFAEYEDHFILPKQTPNSETVWLAFPVVIREGSNFTRREMSTYLEELGIQTRPVFTGNVLRQPAFKGIEHKLFTSENPNTEEVMRGGMVFACHQGLKDEQLAYLQHSIDQFLATRAE